MYKCWSCGTEHEDIASNDAYKRGYDAAVLDLAPNLQIAYEQGYNEAKRTLLTPMQAEQFDAMMEALDNEHVDWCRDLYCGGCVEIKDNDD